METFITICITIAVVCGLVVFLSLLFPVKTVDRNAFIPHGPYSAEWDKTLNGLLDRYEFTPGVTVRTAMLGGVEIWIDNHPYASFRPRCLAVYPSEATRERAARRYVRDMCSGTWYRRSAEVVRRVEAFRLN